MAKSDLFSWHISRRTPTLISTTDLSHCKPGASVSQNPLSPWEALQSKQIEIPRGYLQLLTKLPISLAGPVDNVLLR